MTIMNVVYYDKLTNTGRIPAWARAERYEYCENFPELSSAQNKNGLLQRITALFLPVPR